MQKMQVMQAERAMRVRPAHLWVNFRVKRKSPRLQLTSSLRLRMQTNFPVCLKKIGKITHSLSSLRRRNFTSVLASCKQRRLERGRESREGGSSQFKGSSCVSKQLKGAQHNTHTHISCVYLQIGLVRRVNRTSSEERDKRQRGVLAGGTLEPLKCNLLSQILFCDNAMYLRTF